MLMKGLKYRFVKACKFILLTFYHKPRRIFDLCCNSKKYCSHESYFPEKKQKNQFQIFSDQLRSILNYSAINEFYFPYGFDVKSTKEMDEYLHYAEFMKVRDKCNLMNRHSSTFLLRNKFYFGIFADTFGVDSGKNIALISNQLCYSITKKKTETINEIIATLPIGDYFVKLVGGECGCGIFRLRKDTDSIYIDGHSASIAKLMQLISTGQFLIQGKIEQHPSLAALHESSINSIRLVTIKNVKTGDVSVFPSILRVGTGGSFVDNTSQGGLALGIDMQTGKLYEYGFYKPQFGTKVPKHPDSGIVFKDYSIPYFEEAKQTAMMLHTMLPDVYSVGWDVAIGKDGPIFIEGNDNWEINGPQICHGGLKNLFYEMLGV